MNIFRNKKGETIAETVIALSILAVGITIASSISASSLRNISSSKNRVMAVNIAREGIEAVRNIRDTNWLQYSSKKRQCWNHMPQDYNAGDGSIPTCDGTTPIEPGTYIVYKAGNDVLPKVNRNRRWRLASMPAPVSSSTQAIQPGYKLWLVDTDTAADSGQRIVIDSTGTKITTTGDRVLDNDEDMYNHVTAGIAVEALGGASPDGALDTKAIRETAFARIITIEYLPNTGTPVTPLQAGNVGDEYNRMLVTSRVEWVQGPNLFSSELKTILTDYLDRENLTD